MKHIYFIAIIIITTIYQFTDNILMIEHLRSRLYLDGDDVLITPAKGNTTVEHAPVDCASARRDRRLSPTVYDGLLLLLLCCCCCYVSRATRADVRAALVPHANSTTTSPTATVYRGYLPPPTAARLSSINIIVFNTRPRQTVHLHITGAAQRFRLRSF